MADWALVFPPIMQGLSSSSMFFYVLLALAGVYMFFASKALRAEEDAEAATAVTTNATVTTDTNNERVADIADQAIASSEGRAIRILAVCGNGQGSSMMMKMKIGKYLEKKGIPHVMDSCAVSDYKSKLASTDIIVSSKHLAGEMDAGEGKFVLGVQNMLNPNSFGDELLGLINKNLAN